MKQKIIALSDMHGALPDKKAFEGADLILLAGDICPPYREEREKNGWRWVNDCLKPWLQSLGAPVVAIAGNHDFCFYDDPQRAKNLPWFYLQDQSLQINGLNIYGTPWVSKVGTRETDWAFLLSSGAEAHKFENIPQNLDILLCHNVPTDWDAEHLGSFQLGFAVLEKRPKMVVCGHIHNRFGKIVLKDIPVWNVAISEGTSVRGYRLGTRPTTHLIYPDCLNY